MSKKIVLGLILTLSLLLRLVDITKVPPGVYLDEATIGYNAYSIANWGKDQYGMSWPVYFRSMVEFKTPLYVYLTVLPVMLMEMTPLAIRIVSIISGMVVVLFTYLLMQQLFRREQFSLLASLFVGIAPWAILNSRSALEPNLALAIFLISLSLFYKGLGKRYLLPVSFVLLALTNYAYNAYRFFSVVVVGLLILFNYPILQKFKKIILISLCLFVVVLLPQLLLLNSAAGTRRYQVLSYTSESYFRENGSSFHNMPFGHGLYVLYTFLGKYFDYISPKSLFFDSDPTGVRGIPELSAFYSWMIIPFLMAVVHLINRRRHKTVLFLVLTGLLSIIPAALTTDNLYQIRVLPFLWVVTLGVALGTGLVLGKIKQPWRSAILVVVIMVSLVNLYVNYFNLLRVERKVDHSGTLNELFDYTQRNSDTQFIVDLTEPLAYGVALYQYKVDPQVSARMEGLDIRNYYDDEVLKREHRFDNLDFRKIDWILDTQHPRLLLVGDEQTISEYQVKDYKLQEVLKFSALLDPRSVSIYRTAP